MRINITNKKTLERVLKRKRLHDLTPSELDLGGMLRDILKRANEFVPSESGSIFLDDPLMDERKKKPGILYFVACFGRGSSPLTDSTIPVGVGIVGKAYGTGKAYMSRRVTTDPHFYEEIDKKTKFRTKSVICVPIKIRGITIGVLELINRVGKINFTNKDLTLIKIFAAYTSTLIQNSLDAKKFHELSMMDNLTGLFNDRFFFDFLGKKVKAAIAGNKDLSLVFFDLDKFKEVNDTHGHLAGSELLKEIGQILLDYMKWENITPVRYGGDEYTIILPGAKIEKAAMFAENLRYTIEKRVFIGKKVSTEIPALKIKGVITASIGVASLNKNVKKDIPISQMRESLIKASDSAMYNAKASGKNCVVIAEEIYPLRHRLKD